MNRLRAFIADNPETLSRVAPFALFMAFIGVEEALHFVSARGFGEIPYSLFLFLYPLKTITTGLLLLHFRRSYTELIWNDLAKLGGLFLSILTGFVVFVLWVKMTWPWAVLGTPIGFDPTIVPENSIRYLLIGFRVAGAAIVVPIMEELFWRSWLQRYLISPDFLSVTIGKVTVSSFLIGTILFGLEHNLWLAGIMAGAAYTLLINRTKSLTQCIVAHSATNLLLSIFVLLTGKWEFW
jgi:CAAX prenyl protease-like protein